MTRPYGVKFLEFLFPLVACCQEKSNQEIENLTDFEAKIVCQAIREQNEELKLLRQKTRSTIKESEAEIVRLKAKKVESGVENLVELRSSLNEVNSSIDGSLQALECDDNGNLPDNLQPKIINESDAEKLKTTLKEAMAKSTAILTEMKSQPPETVEALLLKETQKFQQLVAQKETNSKRLEEITAKNQAILEKSVSEARLVKNLIRDISIDENSDEKENQKPGKRVKKERRRDTGKLC